MPQNVLDSDNNQPATPINGWRELGKVFLAYISTSIFVSGLVNILVAWYYPSYYSTEIFAIDNLLEFTFATQWFDFCCLGLKEGLRIGTIIGFFYSLGFLVITKLKGEFALFLAQIPLLLLLTSLGGVIGFLYADLLFSNSSYNNYWIYLISNVKLWLLYGNIFAAVVGIASIHRQWKKQ